MSARQWLPRTGNALSGASTSYCCAVFVSAGVVSQFPSLRLQFLANVILSVPKSMLEGVSDDLLSAAEASDESRRERADSAQEPEHAKQRCL